LKGLLIAAGIILILIIIVWAGLKVKPARFTDFPQKPGPIETIALPDGLPAPVERYYRKIYGDKIPVIKSAVLSGRATLRPFGPITFQGRFRFTHDVTGHAYRHYIEATFFGLPIFHVNEGYLDGKSYFEGPFGLTDQGPKVDQAANLGMWAEFWSEPSAFLTDPQVHWIAVDEENALLEVPFENTKEHFIVRFDPQTGLPRYTEAMRYQNSNSAQKSLWITTAVSDDWQNGRLVRSVGAATWLQDGKPWALFTIEDFRYNVDVSSYIRARGE
jgi:hypothetical protein